MEAGAERRLVEVSSEWVDELQLLVSEGDSLKVHVVSNGTSSREAGTGGRGGGRGGGGGGGGRAGGGRAGGGRGDGVDLAGRHGWKPLHFGPPFVIGAAGPYSFRMSALSKDFVLQRFFYGKKKRQEEKKIQKLKRSQVPSNNTKPHPPICSGH